MDNEKATFEELCRMIEKGMDADQACTWAANNGLRITVEQRDYLERDLEAFDTSMIPSYVEGEDDCEPIAIPAPERELEDKPAKKEVEAKHLTKDEKRRAILNLIFLLVGIGAVITYFVTR